MVKTKLSIDIVIDNDVNNQKKYGLYTCLLKEDHYKAEILLPIEALKEIKAKLPWKIKEVVDKAIENYTKNEN